MKTRTKKILVLVGLPFMVLTMVVLAQFSPKNAIEERLIAEMEKAGLTNISLAVEDYDHNRITFSTLRFSKDDVEVAATNLTISASKLPYLEILRGLYSNIAAEWSVESLQVQGIAYPLPVMSGKGDIVFLADIPQVSGSLASADKSASVIFTVNNERINLEQVQLPWEGAIISAKEVEYSLIDPQPIYLVLYVQKLPLERLLGLITGDKATATGDISGAIPVVIAPDGGFMPGIAHLETGESGRVSILPEVLPGENSYMQLAREALADFHYKNLTLDSKTDPQGKLAIEIKLEGNNPNVQEGQTIKLNVNLTGDVLELLEKTLVPSTNPSQFLEQK